MQKICVFCGERPERKTAEHVIPQWLIEFTGNPNRIAEFGYKDINNPKSGKRKYSFDAFKFPSCELCNNEFAKLEANAKTIVHSIISADSLSMAELSVLLDWFDKIRVGLWLGWRYLDKDPGGVTPNYQITNRIGIKDRMLAIFKSDGEKEGINMIGCDMPSFWYAPCCFSLRINNYWFLNISFNDMFSRRIGFPYSKESSLRDDGQIEAILTVGRNRIMMPLLKKWLRIHGTELYQPMFNEQVRDPIAKEFYDTEYVRQRSMSWEQGIGKVFILDNRRIQEYPISPSKAWIPSRTYEFEHLMFEMQTFTLEWQNHINEISLSIKMINKEKILDHENNIRRATSLNEYIIELLRKQAKRHGIDNLSLK